LGRDNNGSILWFLIGAAAGFVGAVLLAPESGEQARNKLAEQAQKGSKYLSESGRDLYEKGRDLYEKGREIAEDAAEMYEKGRSLAEKQINESV
jgi:gas vesicle protein